MKDVSDYLLQLYNSGSTWAKAIAFISMFGMLWVGSRIKKMKKEQNADDTRAIRAKDQADNKSENQKIEDQWKPLDDPDEKP